MNQVNMIGRLGADVELRYMSTSQRAVARMPVVVHGRQESLAHETEGSYMGYLPELSDYHSSTHRRVAGALGKRMTKTIPAIGGITRPWSPWETTWMA